LISPEQQLAGNVPFVLIGNKVDLIPEVGEVIDRNECKRYAEEESSIYVETSAKTGINVDEAFTTLTKLIISKNS
jgi:GTPase SAR1 family protein